MGENTRMMCIDWEPHIVAPSAFSIRNMDATTPDSSLLGNCFGNSQWICCGILRAVWDFMMYRVKFGNCGILPSTLVPRPLLSRGCFLRTWAVLSWVGVVLFGVNSISLFIIVPSIQNTMIHSHEKSLAIPGDTRTFQTTFLDFLLLEPPLFSWTSWTQI